MTLLTSLLACPYDAPPPPAAPLFGDVPGYPGATKLCESTGTLAHGTSSIVHFVSDDDPAKVLAFYQASHGSAVLQPSGDRLLVRLDTDTFAVLGPAGKTDYDCGKPPTATARSSIVVVRLERLVE